MKSGLDFRPNAPPSSVTCTVTFATSTLRYCGDRVARVLRRLRRGPGLDLAVLSRARPPPPAPSARATGAACSTRRVTLRAAAASAAATSPLRAPRLARLRARTPRASPCTPSSRSAPFGPASQVILSASRPCMRRPGVLRDHRHAAQRQEAAGDRRLGNAHDALHARAPCAPRRRRRSRPCRPTPAAAR